MIWIKIRVKVGVKGRGGAKFGVKVGEESRFGIKVGGQGRGRGQG